MIYHPEKKVEILAKRAKREHLSGMPKTEIQQSPEETDVMCDSPLCRRLRMLENDISLTTQI